MSKIFTVFGVTGQQGGALIRYLLDHPVFSKEYRFRGVTRNASKPAGVALRERGVEIVEVPICPYTENSGNGERKSKREKRRRGIRYLTRM